MRDQLSVAGCQLPVANHQPPTTNHSPLHVEIRQMQPGDCETCWLLNRLAFGEFAATRREIESVVSPLVASIGFVACLWQPVARRSVVVGFIAGDVPRCGELRILELVVAQECRVQGVGRRLVEHAADWWAAWGAPKAVRTLTTLVRERNLAAQLFFRRLKFRCTRVVPRPWRELPEEDGYRFRRLAGSRMPT